MIDPKKASEDLKRHDSDLDELQRLINDRVPKGLDARRIADKEVWSRLDKLNIRPTTEDESHREMYVSGSLSFEEYASYIEKRLVRK